MRYVFFVLLFCSSTLFAKSEPPLIYLTWKHDPTTTMTIQWITSNKDSDNTVQYQPRTKDKKKTPWTQSFGTHKILPEKQPYFLHRIELHDLKPNSIYQFRLGKDANTYSFRTMPQNLKEPIRFVIGADACNSSGKKFRNMNRRAAKTNPRFAVIGGDLAYSVQHGDKKSDENFDRWKEFFQCWTEEMKDKDGCLIPLMVTIGNHEVKGGYNKTSEQAQFYYAFFDKATYDFGFGNYLHFIFLDSGHTNRVKGKQTDWLERTLKTHRNYVHRFAVYHVGAYPSTGKIDESTRVNIRKNWVPLFEKYKINACFEGHDHAYKRTHALLKGKTHPDGVVYFGDGSWGVKPRKPVKKRSYMAHSAESQQVLVVEVSDQDRKFWAIDPDGKVIDHLEQIIP